MQLYISCCFVSSGDAGMQCRLVSCHKIYLARVSAKQPERIKKRQLAATMAMQYSVPLRHQQVDGNENHVKEILDFTALAAFGYSIKSLSYKIQYFRKGCYEMYLILTLRAIKRKRNPFKG